MQFTKRIFATISATLMPAIVFAGNLESTIQNIQRKLTGQIAILVGGIFIAVAGYKMFSGKGGATSSVVFCLIAAIVIIKSQDIIQWATSAL